MKERPVIFNGEMVRAILDGRKTQTRRALNWKRQPYTEMAERDDGSLWPWAEDGERGGDIWFSCPFGEVGDRLWVRETFGDCGNRLVYRADTEDGAASQVKRWVPSIHMPRWASRITLEITGVRVERLQDISEADAIAEGGTKHFNIDWFGPLWASIYGVDSWNSNPWVWVIEFRRVEVRDASK
ncbi:hypothetical protein [Serratia marcescens]|uniref:hypothetical protein n=1 Tax=Serratia marcescens TaxID=615 RepID=UPI0036FC7919